MRRLPPTIACSLNVSLAPLALLKTRWSPYCCMVGSLSEWTFGSTGAGEAGPADHVRKAGVVHADFHADGFAGTEHRLQCDAVTGRSLEEHVPERAEIDELSAPVQRVRRAVGAETGLAQQQRLHDTALARPVQAGENRQMPEGTVCSSKHLKFTIRILSIMPPPSAEDPRCA